MSEVIQAANFVTGAILGCLGIVVIVCTILTINNLFTRFWKPVKIFTYVVKEVPIEQAPAAVQSQVQQSKQEPSL